MLREAQQDIAKKNINVIWPRRVCTLIVLYCLL